MDRSIRASEFLKLFNGKPHLCVSMYSPMAPPAVLFLLIDNNVTPHGQAGDILFNFIQRSILMHIGTQWQMIEMTAIQNGVPHPYLPEGRLSFDRMGCPCWVPMSDLRIHNTGLESISRILNAFVMSEVITRLISHPTQLESETDFVLL
jgi:hypothetical protein